MVEMIQSGDIKLPAEFQMPLYEKLIRQPGKGAEVLCICRDCDRNSAKISDPVVLRSTVRGLKQGSEETRQVPAVAGSNKIIVHCQFTDAHGKVLLDRDIHGKVRFLGENLESTYDFAKKAANVARENVSGTGGT